MWDLLDFLPIPVTQKKPRNTVDIGFFFKSVLHSHLPTIHVVFSATAFLTDKVVREGDACWPVGQSMPSKSLHIVHVRLEKGRIQLGGVDVSQEMHLISVHTVAFDSRPKSETKWGANGALVESTNVD